MDALLQSGLIQTVLWVGLIVFVVLRFEGTIRDEVIPRINGIGAMGLRLDLAQHVVEDGLTKPGNPAPSGASREILARLRASEERLRETSILWLDDHPVRNTVERRFLTRCGIWVETATSTADAKEALRWARYNLVISDMKRDEEQPTPRVEEAARESLGCAKVIYYIRQVDDARPIASGVFGIADRPEQLYHLVFDALGVPRAPAKG